MIYLLDTDTLIYWMKGNKPISNKVLSIGFHSIKASNISKAELYYGAYKSKKANENLIAIHCRTLFILAPAGNDERQAVGD